SFHASYNITDDLVLRFAYANTIGRPDFSNILPLVSANLSPEDDSTIPTVEYNNTGLLPYESDNFDLTLEYYFRNGGLLTASVFRKDVSNFIADAPPVIADAALLEELNLPAEFLGARVTTQRNVPGTSRISGVELNFRQRLDFLGPIGEKLEFFANATKLSLDGESEQIFDDFIKETANVGITYRSNPWTLRLNVNYRGEQILGGLSSSVYPAAGNFAEYFDDRIYVDVNAEYRLSERLGVFLNVRNLFNEPQDNIRFADGTP